MYTKTPDKIRASGFGKKIKKRRMRIVCYEEFDDFISNQNNSADSQQISSNHFCENDTYTENSTNF